MFGARKNDRTLVAVLRQILFQQRGLFGLRDEMHRLVDPVSDRTFGRNGNAHGVIQVSLGQFGHQLRHRCRKQQRLALCRQIGRDLAEIVDEAHVQHLVGLVQHQKLGFFQDNCAAIHQVQQAAGCRHQNIHAVRQGFDLFGHWNTADDDTDFQRRAADKTDKVIRDLFGQFARRREDQRTHGFRRGLEAGGEKFVDQRQAEGRRFTGTGLRQTHDVAAFQNQRDCPRLDGRWIGETVRFQFGEQNIGEPEGCKIRQVVNLSNSGLSAKNANPVALFPQGSDRSRHLRLELTLDCIVRQAVKPLSRSVCLARTAHIVTLTVNSQPKSTKPPEDCTVWPPKRCAAAPVLIQVKTLTWPMW